MAKFRTTKGPMMSKLGKLWYREAPAFGHYSILRKPAGRYIEDESDITCRVTPQPECRFNNIFEYDSYFTDDTVTVKIIELRVKHSKKSIDYLHIFYQTTSKDGTRKEYGVHHEIAPNRTGEEKETTRLRLNEEEFIKGIRVFAPPYFDDIDTRYGITFVTNQRRAHFGYKRKVQYDLLDNPPFTGVVAFVVNNKFAEQDNNVTNQHHVEIGFYSRHFGWDILGTYILMRQLIKQRRARVRSSLLSIQSQSDEFTMKGLMTVDDDIFRYIIKFMA